MLEKSDSGIENGKAIIYINDELVADENAMITWINTDPEWKSLRFGWYLDGRAPFEEEGQETNLSFDDIYVDDTWQAVYIGNNKDWDFCTYREIQILTAWSEDSITLTINQGTLQNGETAYLFVSNNEGVLSDGYLLTIGQNIPVPGDLSKDGEVNIIDIQICVNIVLGTETNPEIITRADINKDGSIDVSDVQEILNIVLVR